MRRWQADTAVPVGDRFLCWVNYLLGFILCDMAVDDASLKLWPPVRDTPVLPPDEVHCFESSTAAGAGDVRFVNIEARCCCGDHGRPEHVRTRRLLVHRDHLDLSLSVDEPLELVKDGLLDCDELWTL